MRVKDCNVLNYCYRVKPSGDVSDSLEYKRCFLCAGPDVTARCSGHWDCTKTVRVAADGVW